MSFGEAGVTEAEAKHEDPNATEPLNERVARLVSEFRVAFARWRARRVMRQTHFIDEKDRRKKKTDFLAMLSEKKLLWFVDAADVADGFCREVKTWGTTAIPIAATFLESASQQQKRAFKREILKKYDVPFDIILALHTYHGLKFTKRELAVQAYKDTVRQRKLGIETANGWHMSFGSFVPDEDGAHTKHLDWLYRPDAYDRLERVARVDVQRRHEQAAGLRA